MIQSVIVKFIKFIALFVLFAYIAIITTSKWHNIRVYPQEIGCTPGQEAIVVEKNIWWIVSKKIEITKENSYYSKLMKSAINILHPNKHTRQYKEFPYWGFFLGLIFVFLIL